MNYKKNKTMDYIQLVPQLITNSQGLSNEIKNRMRSNHLFSEFELKATNQFNFFIKESEKRHLGSKYGTKMDYILKASKKRGQKEAFKILNDNFYLDKELIKERKKMLKKSTNEIHDNILDTIKKIKGLKKVNNYWSNNKSNKSMNTRKKIMPLNEEIILDKDKMSLDKKKNEINTVFNKEEKKIKKFFDTYKTYLSKVDDIPYEKTEDNMTKKINNKIHFIVPKIQLLNYTKSFTSIKTKKDIDNENRINLKKLMQYSVSKKDISPFEYKKKKFCLTIPNIKEEDNHLETKYTNSLVFQKALNECCTFRNKFLNKNETIKEKLGIDKIPSLKEYENLIKHNFSTIKKKRRYLNEINSKKQKDFGKNRKDLLITKIDENLNYLNNFENNLKINKNMITI